MNRFLSVSHHYKYLSARARGSVGDRSLPGSRLSCSSPLQKPRPGAGDQGAALHGRRGCWSKGTECCLSKGGWNKGGWGKGTKCCLIWFCSFESKPWADQRTSLFQGLPTCNMKDFFLQGSNLCFCFLSEVILVFSGCFSMLSRWTDVLRWKPPSLETISNWTDMFGWISQKTVKSWRSSLDLIFGHWTKLCTKGSFLQRIKKKKPRDHLKAGC